MKKLVGLPLESSSTLEAPMRAQRTCWLDSLSGDVVIDEAAHVRKLTEEAPTVMYGSARGHQGRTGAVRVP